MSFESKLGSPMVARAANRVHRHHVAVIAYHGVADSGAFARQLDAIGDLVSFVSPDDLRAALAGASLPDHAALVTFDDGERSTLVNGLPVLSARDIPAMMFVCGGLLDGSTPFWWSEVEATSPQGHETVRRLWTVPDPERRRTLEELRNDAAPVEASHLTGAELRDVAAAGVEVGNHTWDHPWLDRCEPAEVRRQIVDSHRALEGIGISPRAFAYPFGNVDPRAEPVLQELGYDLAFAYDARHGRTDESALRISRLQLAADASPERARLVISGIHGTAKRLLRRV